MPKGNEFRSVRAYPPFVARAVTTVCAVQPDLFTTNGDRGAKRTARVASAKAWCRTCPLLDECRDWAIDNFQTGVWGATDEFERAIERRRRSRVAA